MSPLRVLSVASEVYPLIKTGGLADVAGALPAALQAEGVEMRTLLPGYPDVLKALPGPRHLMHLPDLFGGPASLLAGQAAGLELFVLDAPHLFARPGNPYLGPDGRDWPDNGLRFAALARVAALIGWGAVAFFVPDVIHAHDWQAALVPAYLRYDPRPRPATIVTVHNMAFQGVFPRDLLAPLGLPPEAFHIHGIEYYGNISFLKGGLQFADRITTVSPTYAREITTDEGGMGLGGLLRERSGVLSGILNGIDVKVWNPATDSALASRYCATHVSPRAANKAALQARFGLHPRPAAPLLGVISRLSGQKGLDLLLDCLPVLLEEGMQLAVLGTGEKALEERYRAAAEAHPGRIAAVIGYDEALAHRIQAGCDALLVPSRFEPCGLTQLCALRYGAVPIVARVGGLADTVIDADGPEAKPTGFCFTPVTAERLAATLRRAALAYHDGPWRQLQQNGMATDVSWSSRASRYAALYRDAVKQRA